jgi:hypothetical protein
LVSALLKFALKHTLRRFELSVGDDCDVDCYELFEEFQVLRSVISSHISDIRYMFKFIVQRKLSVVFMLLRIITTVTVTTASAE